MTFSQQQSLNMFNFDTTIFMMQRKNEEIKPEGGTRIRRWKKMKARDHREGVEKTHDERHTKGATKCLCKTMPNTKWLSLLLSLKE